jgi:hypothetical protein
MRSARLSRAAGAGWFSLISLLLLLLLLVACASAPREDAGAEDRLLIVAVDDAAEVLPTPGSTPRARHAGAQGYAGSTRAEAVAAALAQDHQLQEQAFWSIAPLKLRCMLYRVAPGADRQALLARLARDSRVQLVQPLNEFQTLASPMANAKAPAPGVAPAGPGIGAPTQPVLPTHALPYDDPYVGLQRGFISMQVAAAQRWSQGDGVRVALIDSGVDAEHPDLAGSIVKQRNFVRADHPGPGRGEQHGTEMAGIIAAVANNQKGIVGIAPQARLLALRACWPVAGGRSRCDSFSLAQALGAAIADGSDIINLSLGGPADPLLQRLLEHAMRQGTVVVAAAPAAGAENGFPSGVAGVLSVGSSDEAKAHGLSAPARDILSLAPGGGYGYVSGTSVAAAHVTGAVAVLRALQPKLTAQTARDWLMAGAAADSSAAASRVPVGTSIDLCWAVRRLRPAAECNTAAAAAQ